MLNFRNIFHLNSSYLRFSLCGVGGTCLLSGLIVLTCIDQDDARHSFGHTGGMLAIITCAVDNLAKLISKNIVKFKNILTIDVFTRKWQWVFGGNNMIYGSFFLFYL